MYLILQQNEPDDYVIATGITTTIRDFIKSTAAEIGLEITFSGRDREEKGYLTAIDKSIFTQKVGEKYFKNLQTRLKRVPFVASSVSEKIVNAPLVVVDPFYFRPTEVDLLIDDNTKDRERLGWSPKYDLKALITDMMASDENLIKKDQYLYEGGYLIFNYFE